MDGVGISCLEYMRNQCYSVYKRDPDHHPQDIQMATMPQYRAAMFPNPVQHHLATSSLISSIQHLVHHITLKSEVFSLGLNEVQRFIKVQILTFYSCPKNSIIGQIISDNHSSHQLPGMTFPGCNLQVSSHCTLAMADCLANYMVELFHQRKIHQLGMKNLLENFSSIPKPKYVLLCGLHHWLRIKAVCLPNIDIICLAKGVQKGGLENVQLNEETDHTKDNTFSGAWKELLDPTLITNWAGNILAWYLPSSIKPDLEEYSDTQDSAAAVQKSEGFSWHTPPELFKAEAKLKGTINISPVWFQQGQHVSYIFDLHLRQ
ncbi:hypothetical protein JVT61DRAFT_1631 [Boletus reticuloceps]|uniref:Uncharacterized protein n=1 Tax=Boletus reticuloceps TaxID=495285 RepID=A0A8I2YQK8_9AGAM|nr:hypothetical protein JVT61DRAFT_1631 [Boletus reticuloceps]